MDKLNDEKIQALAEKGFNSNADSFSVYEQEQLDSYLSLFHQLKSEPDYELPANFASIITDRIGVKLKRRSDLKFNFFAALGMFVGLTIAYFLLGFINDEIGNQFLLIILKFKWLMLIGTVLLIGTLVVDQKMLKQTI